MDPAADDLVRQHYQVPDLRSQVARLLGTEPRDWAALAEVDQFHVMGVEATQVIAQRLEVSSDTRILDVGCGFGGPARFLAATYGASVMGVDLSPGFVEVAGWLAEITGLTERARFAAVDGTGLPFAANSFDCAWTLHVGMNVAEKGPFYAEIARVLAPGGRLAVFDFVRGTDEARYPLPWAKEPAGSFLATAMELDRCLVWAGFDLADTEDWSQRAITWLAKARFAPKAPNLVGLVFGTEAKTILENLTNGLLEDRIRLVLRIATRQTARERTAIGESR